MHNTDYQIIILHLKADFDGENPRYRHRNTVATAKIQRECQTYPRPGFNILQQKGDGSPC